MKERPILFSAPMVRAILDGMKSQTRRTVKNRGHLPEFRGPRGCEDDAECWGWENPDTGLHIGIIPSSSNGYKDSILCPYGVIGDRLWVRETWADLPHGLNYSEGESTLVFRADGDIAIKWRPSIFMPRRASRITLEITNIRVERLNEISRGDCMAEGCPFPNMQDGPNPRDWYKDIWETLNGKGSFDDRWVWVIEFKQL